MRVYLHFNIVCGPKNEIESVYGGHECVIKSHYVRNASKMTRNMLSDEERAIGLE
jgi:hypothetical protein